MVYLYQQTNKGRVISSVILPEYFTTNEPYGSIYQLTERELKRLRNSWAEKFSNEIFPLINEERFSVLYSNNPASRPNNPVNVYVGLLILKEIFSQSDEECLDSLKFDIRYQYALHKTSFKEQPVSKNSLTNFRTAVYRYNEEYGVDLIQEEVESHAKKFAELLNIEGRMVKDGFTDDKLVMQEVIKA